MKKLPPFGKQFQPVPRNGVQVATGPSAWDFQKTHSQPVMVLPDDAEPEDFEWPSDGMPALIFECGTYDDDRLISMATALLWANASSVIAHRSAMLAGYPKLYAMPDNLEPINFANFDLEKIESQMRDYYPEAYGDPIVYFYPEVQYVAA